MDALNQFRVKMEGETLLPKQEMDLLPERQKMV